jgi:hypothetical protein
MNRTHFDALTRQMGAIDRKTSLKVLGGSLAAAAVARPLAAEAGKHNKKCKKKAKKKCSKQVKPCKEFWDDVCGSSQECKDYYHNCCDFLQNCNGSQYFDCAFIDGIIPD